MRAAICAGPFLATALFLGSPAAKAVVIGQPTSANLPAAPSETLNQLREQYKRPSTIPFPKDNPYTVAKVALGKMLYFDTRLSGANLLSCAACHNPGYGWGDGQPKGVGHLMNRLGRRSPTIINAAYGQIFMWDGRMASLEQQALGPITAGAEMSLPIEQLAARLQAVPGYPPLFAAAFPKDGITPQNVARAIATFERTVVSAQSPFDAWIAGDEKAISADAKHGFELFNTKAGCSSCHSGWNFSNDSFHDIGLPSADIGRGQFLPSVKKMQHAFKTPGLRDIALRGPYMHDGSLLTLAAVIDHYDKGGIDRPSRSVQIQPLNLTPQEKQDLVAFLLTLTSEAQPMTVPVLPR